MSNDEKSDDDKVKLEPNLSLINGVTVIVGSIIGSGIFLTPNLVLKDAGSVNLSLVVWIAAGIFSMIGAYCYAELGCMIKRSGADYAYIMETFGRWPAFMRLWVEALIVRPGMQAAVALTFSLYVLKPFYLQENGEKAPDMLLKLVAILGMCLLTLVNCYSVKLATRVQDYFTVAKLSALALIIGTGVYELIMNQSVDNFTWTGTSSNYTVVGLSFYAALFSYNGWNYLNFITEELKNPVRNLPRAIAISIVLVTLVYVLTNIAFYTTIGRDEMLGMSAVAIEFADIHYGSKFAWLIPLAVAFSCFGGLNGILLTSSRLFYAGARERQMPLVLTMVQISRRTPVPAVLCQTLLAIVYVHFPSLNALINSVGFANWLAIAIGVLCVPVLRYTKPELKRPIKINLVWPVIYVAASAVLIGTSAYAEPYTTLIGTALILLGVPVYLLLVRSRKTGANDRTSLVSRTMDGLTMAVQKLFLVVN